MRFTCLMPLLFLGQFLFAQELPPIVAYEPDDYHAGNQNWMLSQDGQNYLYAANNQGLLEFNGQQWRL
ncbi:MAG: hypothetical protein AAGA31_05160, partial [Bacteroidota bacterium]